jgi:Trypsin-co-occurring domain 1
MSNPYKEEKTPLLIEFTKTPKGGLEPVRSPPPARTREELEEISNVAIDKAMTVIQDMAQKVNTAIKNLGEDDKRPDHAEVGFGIRCDTDDGVMISKSLNEATFNVKLLWNNDAGT